MSEETIPKKLLDALPKDMSDAALQSLRDYLTLKETKVQVGSHRMGLRDPDDEKDIAFRDALRKNPNGLIHTAVELAEKETPQGLRMFYPRIYPNIANYHSPKVWAALTAIHMQHCGQIGINNSPAATRLMLPGLPYMIAHMMPYMFLGEEFTKAVQRTDFRDEIECATGRERGGEDCGGTAGEESEVAGTHREKAGCRVGG